MADYITRIRTISGDKQIDYNSLANLPDFSFVEDMQTQIDELNVAVADNQDILNGLSEAVTTAQESADGAMSAAEQAMLTAEEAMNLANSGSSGSVDVENTVFRAIKMIDSVTGRLYYLQIRNGVLVSSENYESFEVTGIPEKYYAGTEPDLSNLVVMAMYADGSSSAVYNYTVDVSEPVDGVVVFMVNYLGNSKTYDVPCVNFASFDVSGVPEPCLAGEPSDLSNLIVTATYEDGSVYRIDRYTVSESTVDDETIEITITCAGMSNSYEVAVFRRFDQNTLSNLFVDFVYTDNGNGTYTIVDWKGTLNGQPSTEIVVPNNRQIIVNTDWE